VFRFVFIYENKKKQRLRESGAVQMDAQQTAFSNMTDKENPK